MRLWPLILLCACQVPFEINRKDLGPFRVAALGVQDGVARAAIWSGLGLYHDEAPVLTWTLDGEPLGEGFDVAVPGPGELGLTVLDPAGEAHEARVTVAEAPPALTIARAAIGPVEDPSLDARAALEERPVAQGVPTGEGLRLRVEGLPEATGVHWMSALGRGSTLELDAVTADVLAEELTYDDGALIEREPVEPGLFHHLALAYDGAGANRWSWIDGAIGDEGPFAQVGERLLRVDAPLEPGRYAFDVALDDSPEGLRFSDPTPVEDLSESTVDCGPAGLPFDPDWAAEGRCPRPALDGARVVMDVR